VVVGPPSKQKAQSSHPSTAKNNNNKLSNLFIVAGYQWFTPVILATQEAKIRRIAVGSQPGEIVLQDPILKKNIHKKGLAKWLKV
jgi:hypothetical protein